MIELKKEVRERIDRSVRIRSLVVFLFAVSLVISVALIVVSARSFGLYEEEREASDRFEDCQQAATRLQTGSYYLTDQVRAYAASGDVAYMNNYFHELDSARRRDGGLAVLKENVSDAGLLAYANAAMAESNKLVLLEERIMWLRATGDGVPEEQLPEEIRVYMPEADDASLSPEACRERAWELAFGREYNVSRETIDNNIQRFSNGLIEKMAQRRDDVTARLNWVQRFIYGMIIIFFVVIGVTFAILTRLVILPLIRSYSLVERQRLLPITGAREMRLLAANYNHILEKQLAKQEQLSYANDHDSLTGAYSRAVFDRFCQDPGTDVPIAMMLVDLDYFKRINDSFGHSVGDRVLKRTAELLIGAFRSDDLVCRIGGDEFSAVLFNMTPENRALLEEKLLMVEDSLKRPIDPALPPCSLSIGVAFGKASEARELHVNADTAMYEAKKGGRGTVAFYKKEE